MPLASCAIRVYCHYFFFYTDPATTEIYTLSLHDALPIYGESVERVWLERDIPRRAGDVIRGEWAQVGRSLDRKSTRLNSSHVRISYAVFCLKKKKHMINAV